jgi:hypothetical protein
MPRAKSSDLTAAVLLLSVFLVCWGSQALQAGEREAITINFDAATVGELPAGFTTAVFCWLIQKSAE